MVRRGRMGLLVALLMAAPVSVALAQSVPALGPGQTRIDEEATGRISGEVLDARTGQPAVGTPVALYQPRATSGRTWPEPWVAEIPEADATPIATVRAASEGQFLFDGLPPGQYRVAALVAKRSESALAMVGRDDPAVFVSLAVGIGALIRGEVLDEAGRPLPDAIVFVVGEEDVQGRNLRAGRPTEGRVSSGADGRFALGDLPPGALWLQAARRDIGFSAPQRFEVVELGEIGGVRLVVRDEAARLRESADQQGGIGISIDFDPSGVRVRRVVEGSAAEAAGLQAGDRVLAIQGRSTAWMGRFEFLSLARGPEGAPVALTIARDGGAPLDIDVVRRRMPDR